MWVLDPVGLNKIAHSNRVGAGPVVGAYADELRGYKPSQDSKMVSQALPMAIRGVHNSPRIVAQRGSFTIFGREPTAINKSDKLSGTNGVIRQVRVSAGMKKAMFEDLFSMGISDSVVYPDLEGLGREIRNRRGF